MRTEVKVLLAAAVALFVWSAIASFATNWRGPDPLGLLAVGLACGFTGWALHHHPRR